jgi:hypothetical protein
MNSARFRHWVSPYGIVAALAPLVAACAMQSERPASAADSRDPPPPPCREASQYERARMAVPPDIVGAASPLWTPFAPFPVPPLDQPLNARVTWRVDSVGSFNPDSIVVEGVRSMSYRKTMMETMAKATFRPPVLYPDRCAVPGKATLTFTARLNP